MLCIHLHGKKKKYFKKSVKLKQLSDSILAVKRIATYLFSTDNSELLLLIEKSGHFESPANF